MTVRAKFVVQTITQSQGWGNNPRIWTVRLTPTSGAGAPENAAFYAATPSGSIDLSLVSEAVGKEFSIGQAFYVDFTPAGN
jgi:hypothetical protein